MHCFFVLGKSIEHRVHVLVHKHMHTSNFTSAEPTHSKNNLIIIKIIYVFNYTLLKSKNACRAIVETDGKTAKHIEMVNVKKATTIKQMKTKFLHPKWIFIFIDDS